MILYKSLYRSVIVIWVGHNVRSGNEEEDELFRLDFTSTLLRNILVLQSLNLCGDCGGKC